MEKATVVSNFERRGWQRATDENWNIYWASVHTVRSIFSVDNSFRLQDGMAINHFPGHMELTRKDLMVKNIKRYMKELVKEGKAVQSFVPVTYLLPADYSLFVEEFRRNPNTVIVKPVGRARGQGIYLVNRLSQLRKFANGNRGGRNENYVVSRYIDNPLLIGGKKFDIRLYVLVTSYRPLRCYLYREGFARFTSAKYNNDTADLENMFVHLTNVSIQKQDENYNDKHGGKWSLKNLRLYLEATWGQDRTDKLFQDIEQIVLLSLKAVQNVIINDKHCFECYGYDIIIDDTLKAWLVEVNASPSLSATTHSDRIMKMALINDVLRVVFPNDKVNMRQPHTHAAVPGAGGFDLLYDEQADNAEQEQREGRRSSSSHRGGGGTKWR